MRVMRKRTYEKYLEGVPLCQNITTGEVRPLSEMILNVEKGFGVIHIDGDKWNNTENNLYVVRVI